MKDLYVMARFVPYYDGTARRAILTFRPANEEAFDYGNQTADVEISTPADPSMDIFETEEDAIQYHWSTYSAAVLSQVNAYFPATEYQLASANDGRCDVFLTVENKKQDISELLNRISDMTLMPGEIPFRDTNGDMVGLTLAQAMSGSRSFGVPANLSAITTAAKISDTKDAAVSYAIPATVTIAVLAGQSVTATLTYADNDAMTTNPIVVDAQTTSNSGVVGLTQTNTLKLTGLIPAGKFRKVTFTKTGTGTATPSTLAAGQEVLL